MTTIKKKKSREEKQLKGSFAGGVLRKNITNVLSDLGLRSEGVTCSWKFTICFLSKNEKEDNTGDD